MPEADMLIHCGDATKKSTLKEFNDFFIWLDAQNYRHKFYIPGNHDWGYTKSLNFRTGLISIVRDMDFKILENELVVVNGIKIYGAAHESYEDIPEGLDLLVTHYPPLGILDELPPFSKNNKGNPYPFHLGSQVLLEQVTDRIKPIYHVFGHIHECGGQFENFKKTVFVNTSVLNEYYEVAHQPTLIII